MVHEIAKLPSPGVETRSCTAIAFVTGIRAGDGADADPTPAALIAATVTVYSVPFSRPLMVQGEVTHESSVTAVPPAVGVATRR